MNKRFKSGPGGSSTNKTGLVLPDGMKGEIALAIEDKELSQSSFFIKWAKIGIRLESTPDEIQDDWDIYNVDGVIYAVKSEV